MRKLESSDRNVQPARCRGHSARYDGALGNLDDDARGDARSPAPGDARSDTGVGGEDDADDKQTATDESGASSTLAVTKFASVRGLSAYFCRDDECYR